MNNKTKNLTDAMSREELVEELNRGNRSRFQRDNFAYLKTRLDFLEQQEEKKNNEQKSDFNNNTIKIAKEANDIAREANKISSNAFSISKISLIISIISLGLAILALLIQKGYF